MKLSVLKSWEIKLQLRLALPKSYYLRAVCYCAINDACGGVPFGFTVMLHVGHLGSRDGVDICCPTVFLFTVKTYDPGLSNINHSIWRVMFLKRTGSFAKTYANTVCS